MNIHCFWVGGKIGLMEALSLMSHVKHGHVVNLWCYEYQHVPGAVILKDARELMPENEVFAYQVGEGQGSYSACSNVFRYKVLNEYGGWWSDLDVIVLKPFDFQDDYVFASERTKNGGCAAASCVIKAPAGSEFTKYCRNVAESVDRSKVEWGVIGPDLIMEAAFALDLHRYIKPPDTFCPYDWFKAEIDPMGHGQDLPPGHAVHLWHEMWRRKSINMDEQFGDCLYERLKSVVLSS